MTFPAYSIFVAVEKENFDDIRSYRDEEAYEVCQRLFGQSEVKALVTSLLPDIPTENIEKQVSGIQNRWDFQNNLILPVFRKNILTTFDELSVSGLEDLDPNQSYLFISNHRDIVLDSAVLNYFLHINDFSTAEIAIGDNLIKEKWIEDLVRLNKSFIVKRGLDNMEMLRASKKLSAYIQDTIVNRKESVWIAQRAGRAKDGNDETNRGLITMFGMSNEGDILDHYASLNIVPVSMSYEFDPCDGRKAQELFVEQNNGEYVKSESEDVESMKLGIILPKGKGHIHFGSCLSQDILKLNPDQKKSALMNDIGELIDERIQGNYKLWSSNYIAAHLSGYENGFEYSESEKEYFVNRLEETTSELKGDQGELKNIILGMYTQPLENSLKRK